MRRLVNDLKAHSSLVVKFRVTQCVPVESDDFLSDSRDLRISS